MTAELIFISPFRSMVDGIPFFLIVAQLDAGPLLEEPLDGFDVAVPAGQLERRLARFVLAVHVEQARRPEPL